MTPKPDLFELVKSLTDGEISAFRKRILGRKGKHVYLQLFEAILEQEDYSEADLKARFKGEKTLNNFSIAKKNLYEKLLEVLCHMPHNQTLETKFDKFRHQVSILLQKSLYKQAMSRVKKAIQIAEKLEAYKRIPDLHDLQREIARAFMAPQAFLNLLKDIRERESWLKELETNLQKYRDLWDQATITQKIPVAMRRTMINSILGHALMQDESECRSVTARLYFYRIWNHLYFVQGRDSGWKFYSEKIVELLDQNPSMLADPGTFIIYINTISDYATNCINFGEFAGAMEAAGQLLEIQKNRKTGGNEALIFSRYWKIQLMYSRRTLDEKGGLEAVQEIKAGLRKYKGKISKMDEMELHHLVSVFLIIMERPYDALPWILHLREDKLSSNRPDLHYFSWLLFLVAHYHMRNLDVVEQQTPGTINYFKEHRAHSPFSKAMLNFFKKVSLARDRDEELALMDALRAEMEKVLEDPRAQQLLKAFDVLSWLDACRAEMPFHEFLRAARQGNPTL